MEIQWPKSDRLAAFRADVEELMKLPIGLEDIRSHPDAATRAIKGSYDPATNTVWLNPEFLGAVGVYVASHEIAHAWQHANGFPRVLSILDVTAFNTISRAERETLNMFSKLHDRIADVVRDSSADQLLALRYSSLLEGTVRLGQPFSESVEAFDPAVFGRELLRLPGVLRMNQHFEPRAYNILWGFGAVSSACSLAAHRLRLEMANQFDEISRDNYNQSNGNIKDVADSLVRIVRENGVDAARACEGTLRKILAYLNVDGSVISLAS